MMFTAVAAVLTLIPAAVPLIHTVSRDYSNNHGTWNVAEVSIGNSALTIL